MKGKFHSEIEFETEEEKDLFCEFVKSGEMMAAFERWKRVKDGLCVNIDLDEWYADFCESFSTNLVENLEEFAKNIEETKRGALELMKAIAKDRKGKSND